MKDLAKPLHVNFGDRMCLSADSFTTDPLISKSSVFATGQPHECVCPICRRQIQVKITLPKDAPAADASLSTPNDTEYPYGYVALMYGSAPAYFAGALVTGRSLMHHSALPKECRILLCTHDVPQSFRELLDPIWTIKDVEYIDKASPWFYRDYRNSRFKKVFTKLRILKDLAGVFGKVILLDLDLLIRGEVDALFSLAAPAAMVRGQYPLAHGETVPIDAFYNGHRQVLGINCGVMLVEPSPAVFNQMIEEVKMEVHPEHWPSNGPEQDYLSRYYNAFGAWTNLSCRFNYQVHLNQYGSLEWHHYNLRGHPGVSVFHFSGRLVKPWSLLLDLRIAHEMDYDSIEDFIKNIAVNAAAELRRVNLTNSVGQDKVKKDPPDRATSQEPGDGFKSHFCGGSESHTRKEQRCYLIRYIHPSWTEADSQSCIEWIRAFREADESQASRVTDLLRSLWRFSTHTSDDN